MNMPVQDLRGPNADEASRLLAKAYALSDDQARRVSNIYEADHDPRYDDFCTEVWNALETSGRLLPLGWFEAVFMECSWVETTKALHAIADAVMATLVRQEISHDAYQVLTLPFLARDTGLAVPRPASQPGKVDLTAVSVEPELV